MKYLRKKNFLMSIPYERPGNQPNGFNMKCQPHYQLQEFNSGVVKCSMGLVFHRKKAGLLSQRNYSQSFC